MEESRRNGSTDGAQNNKLANSESSSMAESHGLSWPEQISLEQEGTKVTKLE
jgi:hypothetical protein